MADYIKTIRQKIGHDMLIMAGAAVIVYHAGEVLLQRRLDNGLWAMHGGAIEVGEAAEETARRELFEETGLVADKLELLNVFSGKEAFHTYPNGDQVCNVTIQYVCREFSGELSPQENEVSELRWFRLDGLPEELSRQTRWQLMAFCEHLKEI